MKFVESIEALGQIYPETPSAPAQQKVAHFMTPAYRRWIMASKFCVVATVGPEGTDCSPRGDNQPVVRELDKHTLMMPDWRGNNRLDSLRNIVSDGRVSLLFMVPGENTVVRVNGVAKLTADPEMTGRFHQKGQNPKSVIMIKIAEIYVQCARALLRSGLWKSGDESAELPSVGDILTEMTSGEFDGVTYDVNWSARAGKTMW